MKTMQCPKCKKNLEDLISITTQGLFVVHLCVNCCFCSAERSSKNFSAKIDDDTANFNIGEETK